MKELFITRGDDEGYFVFYNGRLDNGSSDKFIARKIGISIYEYETLLFQYKAILITRKFCNEEHQEFYFHKESDCQKFCDYLNEKYGIILKLVGD